MINMYYIYFFSHFLKVQRIVNNFKDNYVDIK